MLVVLPTEEVGVMNKKKRPAQFILIMIWRLSCVREVYTLPEFQFLSTESSVWEQGTCATRFVMNACVEW
jgi:hypothetical protein